MPATSEGVLPWSYTICRTNRISSDVMRGGCGTGDAFIARMRRQTVPEQRSKQGYEHTKREHTKLEPKPLTDDTILLTACSVHPNETKTSMVVATVFARTGSHFVSRHPQVETSRFYELQTDDGQKFASEFNRSCALRLLCLLPRLKRHRTRPAPQMSMLGPLLCKPLANFCPGGAPQGHELKKSTLICGGRGGELPSNLIVKFQHMLTCKLLSVISPRIVLDSPSYWLNVSTLIRFVCYV